MIALRNELGLLNSKFYNLDNLKWPLIEYMRTKANSEKTRVENLIKWYFVDNKYIKEIFKQLDLGDI